MKKLKDLKQGELIKAELYFMPNYKNGKYKTDQVEAESQGKDTSDAKVKRELGEEINALGKPLHRK